MPDNMNTLVMTTYFGAMLLIVQVTYIVPVVLRTAFDRMRVV